MLATTGVTRRTLRSNMFTIKPLAQAEVPSSARPSPRLRPARFRLQAGASLNCGSRSVYRSSSGVNDASTVSASRLHSRESRSKWRSVRWPQRRSSRVRFMSRVATAVVVCGTVPNSP